MGVQVGLSQNWMTNLEAAKRLALTQNKLILMVWEEAAQYPLPVLVRNDQGQEVLVDNLFEAPAINQQLWDYFVLLQANEYDYGTLYDAVKDLRGPTYINKLQDDSIKVMDANGNIINLSDEYFYILNLTDFINKYALNTSFLKHQLNSYRTNNSFYGVFYLAAKYVDYAFLVNKKVRPEITTLATAYLNQATKLLPTLNKVHQVQLERRIKLLRLLQELASDKPKKVLRKLKQFNELNMVDINQSLLALLHVSANLKLGKKEKAAQWRPKVSVLDLKRVKYIVGNN